MGDFAQAEQGSRRSAGKDEGLTVHRLYATLSTVAVGSSIKSANTLARLILSGKDFSGRLQSRTLLSDIQIIFMY